MLCLNLYHMWKVLLFWCWAMIRNLSFYFFLSYPLLSEAVCFHAFTFFSLLSFLVMHRLTASPSVPNQPLYFFFSCWVIIYVCSNVTKLIKDCLFKICAIARIEITRWKTGWTAFQSTVRNLCFTSLFCLEEPNLEQCVLFIWIGFCLLHWPRLWGAFLERGLMHCRIQGSLKIQGSGKADQRRVWTHEVYLYKKLLNAQQRLK